MLARRRRSTSTAWCGTTICANRRNSATADQSGGEGGSRSQQPRYRARPARRLPPSICRPARRPGGRSAAGTAGAGDTACRDLRADRDDPARGGRGAEKIFPPVPFIVDVDDFVGHPRPRLRCQSIRTIWNFSVSNSATSTTRCSACSVASRSAIRTAEKAVIRLTSCCGCRKAICPGTNVGRDAGPCQHVAGQQDCGGTRRGGAGDRELGSPAIFRRDGRLPIW